MPLKVTLLLVAAGSFAIGVAVDRLLLASAKDSPEEILSPLVNTVRKSQPVRTRSETSSSNPSAIQGDEPDDAPPSDAFHRLLEKIEAGEPTNFAALGQSILSMPPGPQRRQALHRLASRWGRIDPQAALRWSEDLTGRDQFSTMEDILRHWSDEDPAAAADYVTRLPGSEHTLHLLRDLSHRWAESDRGSALEWSMALEDPALRMRAIRGVASSWAEHDPAGAAAFTTDSLETVNERHHVLEAVARRWGEQDLESALQWARDLEPGDQQRATQSVLRLVAEHNPSEAASIYQDIAAELPQDGPISREYRHMAQEVARVWSSSSPVDAAQWALSLPERGSIQRGAVGDVTEQWMRIDSMAAGEWIRSLPAGETRDSASERVVHMTTNSDPGAAFAWAQSLSQDHRRFGLMHHTLTEWSSVDRPAAQQALSSADLPPEIRQRFGEEFGLSPSPQLQSSQEGTPESR